MLSGGSFMRRSGDKAMPASGASLPRWLLRTGRAALIIYLGTLLVLDLLQSKLIFPGAETQGHPSAKFAPPEGSELVHLRTKAGEHVVALYGTALDERGNPLPDARQRPSLIFFYGNGMCLADTLYEFARFRRLGLNVLIPEYVGYGLSSGSPSETGCYETADAAYDFLLGPSYPDHVRIVAAGWSLGSAVAIDLAARRPVVGLVALSAFSSMADLAQRQFPFLPVSLLLKHRFENLQKIERIECPILIAHSQNDTLIPLDMAERLQAAARVPVSRLFFAGADHNEFFAVGSSQIFPALHEFLQMLSHSPA